MALSYLYRWCLSKYGFEDTVFDAPAVEIDPAKCYVAGEVPGDIYEIAIDEAYLMQLDIEKFQMNINYDPITPGEGHEDAHDVRKARQKALDQFVDRTLTAICTRTHPYAGQAYRIVARLKNEYPVLARAILMYDIAHAGSHARRFLAQNLLFLFLSLKENHASSRAQDVLSSDDDTLLDYLMNMLSKHTEPTREDAQKTLLVRGLLRLGSSRVPEQRPEFVEDALIGKNMELCASLLGLSMRTANFGDLDRDELMCTLAKSPLFSGEIITVEKVDERETILRNLLSAHLVEEALLFRPHLEEDEETDWIKIEHKDALQSVTKTTNFTTTSKCDSHSIGHTADSTTFSSMFEACEGDGAVLNCPMPISQSERDLVPPLDISPRQYSLVGLFCDTGIKTSDILDETYGTEFEVPSVHQLNSSAWEIVVLTSYRSALKQTLTRVLPGSIFDLQYDPLEPTAEDVNRWSHHNVEELRRRCCILRWEGMARKSWLPAQKFYEALIGRVQDDFDTVLRGPERLEPTDHGLLKDKDHALSIVRDCLDGHKYHVRTGPRGPNIAISESIFVWEANSAGIETWKDGLTWATWNEDDFEIGQSTDGSGLMRKTIAFTVFDCVHHVVSYYMSSTVESKEFHLTTSTPS